MPKDFNELYQDADYYGQQPSASLVRYFSLYDLPCRGRALDLGCGTGRNSIYLAKKGFDVLSLDSSSTAIARLNQLSSEQGLSITAREADIREFEPMENHFQFIVANTSIDHLSPQDCYSVAENMISSLAPGGFLFVSVFMVTDPGYNSQGRTVSETAGHVRHFYQTNELAQQFKSMGLLSYQEEYWLDQGHGQPHYHGMARLFAQK